MIVVVNATKMKGKKAGLQARFLQIILKTLNVQSGNHSLNLIVVNSAKFFTEAMLFFGVLTQLYVLFSSSMQCWTILKKIL